MPEYVGWDQWVKEQEEKHLKDENPVLKAHDEAILLLNNRLYILEDDMKNVKEILKYNQIRLPRDFGPKRFAPSVGSHWHV